MRRLPRNVVIGVAIVAGVLLLPTFFLILAFLASGLFGEKLSHDDEMWTSVHLVHGDLAQEPRTFWVGLNEKAFSQAITGASLEVKMLGSVPLPVEVRVPGQAALRVPSPGDESATRDHIDLPLAECPAKGGCLLPFDVELLPGSAEFADGEVYVSVHVSYEAGEDSVPHGAMAAISSVASDGAVVSSLHWLIPPVFLTSEAPTAAQTLHFKLPRGSMPDGEIRPDGTASATWTGGALEAVTPSADVSVQAARPGMIQTLGADRLEVDGYEHNGWWQFEVPLELVCDASFCADDVTVEFTLERGGWAMLGWSNRRGGFRSAAGDFLQGWEVAGTAHLPAESAMSGP